MKKWAILKNGLLAVDYFKTDVQKYFIVRYTGMVYDGHGEHAMAIPGRFVKGPGYVEKKKDKP